MKRFWSYIFIVPLVLAVIFILGALLGPKGFPLNVLVFVGEYAVKALSVVFPSIVSEAFLLRIDPHSSAMGYIALTMWVGFAVCVAIGWILAVVIYYAKQKQPNSAS